VLSHTGPVEAARVPRLLPRLLRRLPERWLLASYRRRLAPLVAAAGPFWRDWVDRTLAELGKGHLLARIELADDLARLPATRHPRGAWSGPTLLLEASDDPAVRPAWRGRLRARFPTAGTHRFEGAGHVAALIDPAGFARVVRDFIRRAAAAAP
jgi:pimeloyl-ACP methyl ester carboxylesterase